MLKECQEKIAYTSTDFYFTFFKPSVVGASCLASTLIASDLLLLSTKRRQAFYLHLANTSNLIDIMEAEKKLMAGYEESVTISKASQMSTAPTSSTASTSIVIIKQYDFEHCIQGKATSKENDQVTRSCHCIQGDKSL